MANPWIVLGRITGLYGVLGWVKVFSYTEPRTAILDYKPLFLRKLRPESGTVFAPVAEERISTLTPDWQPWRIESGRAQGKGVILKFHDFEDRDQAAALIGAELGIARQQLPPLPAGEFYWADLEGLTVINTENIVFGQVSHLFHTGANAVLVVKGERERLIPFVQGQFVQQVDLVEGRILVDWDADF